LILFEIIMGWLGLAWAGLGCIGLPWVALGCLEKSLFLKWHYLEN
jgi:hypothetical protein